MNRRAVAYIRTNDEPSSSAVGSRAQRRAIESWAVRERVAIAAWHVDEDVAAETPIAERPGLVAAYGAVRAHGAGLLVAADARRFAEDQLVSWLIERAALAEGATLETADGSRAKAPPAVAPADTGYARGAVDLARAYERIAFAARVRAALAAKRARGERVGTVPYGFRLAPGGVYTEPDEAEQAVIGAVRGLSGEGLSQRAIVAKLAASGVVGRTGAPLGQTQVAKILRASR
jgi:DNA invertase Pin-like site-specific DNA recombinase